MASISAQAKFAPDGVHCVGKRGTPGCLPRLAAITIANTGRSLLRGPMGYVLTRANWVAVRFRRMVGLRSWPETDGVTSSTRPIRQMLSVRRATLQGYAGMTGRRWPNDVMSHFLRPAPLLTCRVPDRAAIGDATAGWTAREASRWSGPLVRCDRHGVDPNR